MGGTLCSTDWIEIVGADTQTNTAIAQAANTNVDRFCGRAFDIANSVVTINRTVCSRSLPFKVSINFDSNEIVGTSAADSSANVGEQSEGPGGITGFQLSYYQISC